MFSTRGHDDRKSQILMCGGALQEDLKSLPISEGRNSMEFTLKGNESCVVTADLWVWLGGDQVGFYLLAVLMSNGVSSSSKFVGVTERCMVGHAACNMGFLFCTSRHL